MFVVEIEQGVFEGQFSPRTQWRIKKGQVNAAFAFVRH